MSKFVVPKQYKSNLNIRETEHAIKMIKDCFEIDLAKTLNLTRISAPLFVRASSGLNDYLNGTERPVAFDILDERDSNIEIVQSLAKWKRIALKRYEFCEGEGIYTDMNAIRRDEQRDNIHSLYVDQWDWEKIISSENRTMETLIDITKMIYKVIKNTERKISSEFAYLSEILPDEITFITSQELEDMYPNLSSSEREKEYAKRFGAIFVMQIGGTLKSGKQHDGRSPDYDDWSLNGDIIVYYPLLDIGLELSSMGIRVDSTTLLKQLLIRGCLNRTKLDFQSMLLNGELPQTIGGGIGQSRLCMFYLRKAHIGEVQSSIWPQSTERIALENRIKLL